MDIQPWVRLENPLGQDNVRNVLQQWWYSDPTPAQLKRGDMACDNNFHKNVVCCQFEHGQDSVQLYVPGIRPSHHLYFLFYSIESHGAVVVVWGGLPVALVLQHNGLIRRLEHLVWSSPDLVRCRALARSIEPTITTTNAAAADWKQHYFALPLLGAEFQNARENSQPTTGLLFDAFMARLHWFANRPGVLLPVHHHLADKGAFVLCATLTRELPRAMALSFEKARVSREEALFYQRATSFMAAGVGELPILGLFQYNAGFWQWFQKRIVSPTPEDEQAWTRNVPGIMPTIWFSVPFWQWIDCIADWPIHSGGIIHMPVYGPWVFPWIWQSLIQPEAQRHFGAGFQTSENGLKAMLEELRMWPEVMKWAQRATPMPVARARPSGAPESAERALPPPLDDGGGVDLEDLGEFWSVMPPCLRALKSQRRFPLNMERFYLTQILRRAGLSLESIVSFYEMLNDAYPKPKPVPLSQRYSVEAGIEDWQGKEAGNPESGIIYCSQFVHAALDNRGEFHCPYAAAAQQQSPNMSREEVVGRCRQQCVAESGLASERRKQSTWKPWATPAAAMEEGIKNQQMK